MRPPIALSLLASFVLAAPAVHAQAPTGGSGPSDRAPIRQFQPAAPFPSNPTTNLPFAGPDANSDGQRTTVAAAQRVLIELQQLVSQTKQAHWNVSGTLWYVLHGLLQEHYDGLSKQADTVAERILAIGAAANGRPTTLVQRSTIPELPGGFVDDAQVILWFTEAYRVAANVARQGIKETEDPDPTTSNILQEVDALLSKYQWQMRAHFQPTPTDPNRGADLNGGQPVEVPGVRPLAPQAR